MLQLVQLLHNMFWGNSVDEGSRTELHLLGSMNKCAQDGAAQYPLGAISRGQKERLTGSHTMEPVNSSARRFWNFYIGFNSGKWYSKIRKFRIEQDNADIRHYVAASFGYA